VSNGSPCEDIALGFGLGIMVLGAGFGVGGVLILMHIIIDWYVNLGGIVQ